MALGDVAFGMGLDDQIRSAQLEAGIKRPHSTYSRPKELQNRLRAVRFAEEAVQARWQPPAERHAGIGARAQEAPGAAEVQLPPDQYSVAPESFLGMWKDSRGNDVCVCSMDAFEMRPMATLSRAPRPDIHLKIVPRADGWHCGHARLDMARSTATEVCWVFPDGRESVWTPWHSDGEDEEPAGPCMFLPGQQYHFVPQVLLPVGMMCIG
mmetsp:Transcript_71309/g.220377  ORF Transcript_71309/g.220377 Transcript_71309/m.220377 type:complete len:210 (-) Transcript_71309:114-743(-)